MVKRKKKSHKICGEEVTAFVYVQEMSIIIAIAEWLF